MLTWKQVLAMSFLVISSSALAQDTAAGPDVPEDTLTPVRTLDGGQVCDYVVQPGDTLWDIAQLKKTDPYMYRSLWSINNQEITNPHYIYPGQCLNFRPRIQFDDPYVDPGPDPALTALQSAPTVTIQEDGQWTEWKSIGSCSVPVPFTSTESVVPVLANGFIETQERAPAGEIIAGQDNKSELSQGDLVFMRFANSQDVACGDVFSIYVPQGSVRHPLAKKSVLGYVYRVIGEVQVVQVDDEIVTGEIITAWDGVMRNSLITERIPVRASLRPKQPQVPLDGYIVARLNDEAKSFFQDQVIFIDRGRRDQVRSGDRFWVVRRGDEFDAKTMDDESLPDYVVGKAVVFAAGEYMSSAVLVDQDRQLKVGDRIVSTLEN